MPPRGVCLQPPAGRREAHFCPSRQICMTNRCRAMDSIFLERLWYTLTYGCVRLHVCETGSETKAAIRKWRTVYHHQRPRSALGGQPPGTCSRRRAPTIGGDGCWRSLLGRRASVERGPPPARTQPMRDIMLTKTIGIDSPAAAQ
ncbi:integrase core domain-containing protein [Cereibacter sphaeroides]|nr:integrase core domain-containing protein [Cereibacter sphaeroides]